MSAEDFIAKVRRRNGRLFAADEIRIKISVLENLLRQAWADGCAAGEASKSLFEKLFGK